MNAGVCCGKWSVQPQVKNLSAVVSSIEEER